MKLTTGQSKSISIHALREESDPGAASGLPSQDDFYPRPPRGERQNTATDIISGEVFLSTPSARRATAMRRRVATASTISIHALREESDPKLVEIPDLLAVFLSTPSARRATIIVAVGAYRAVFLSTPSARRAT